MTTQNLTVSSKTLADLTFRRHENLKRSIDALMDKGAISHYLPTREGRYVVYRLSKRDSLKLVSTCNPLSVNRLNELWHRIENPSATPVPVPDFTDPASAARAWATQYEQKVQAEQRFAKAKQGKGSGTKLIVIQCEDDSVLERMLEPLRGLVQSTLKAPAGAAA